MTDHAVARTVRGGTGDTEHRRRTRIEPVTYGGYAITAPGFTVETFAAAIERALSDGLTIAPGRAAGTWLVTNVSKGHRREYVVHPRHGCSCRAHGPCKHRALALLVEAITVSVQPRGP